MVQVLPVVSNWIIAVLIVTFDVKMPSRMVAPSTVGGVNLPQS